MKKILLSIIYFLVCIFSPQAQNLYCTTPAGGNEGQGTINKFTIASNILAVPAFFESYAFNPLYTNFIGASDGKLYGMAHGGGNYSAGVIFSYDPISSTYSKLKDFNGPDGALPSGSLIQASNGKLYGMTPNGGSNNVGVIFSYDPSSSVYTKLLDFDGTNGANPGGSLMQASDGKLYGVTDYGGSGPTGVIFSFDPSSSTYVKLLDFDIDGIEGANPLGGLVQASDGKLYGMGGGGSSGNGVIFSFDPSTSVYTKLKDFNNTDGSGPSNGKLKPGNDGKLYGTTINGGNSDKGVIFSYDPSSGNYTKLRDFDGTTGGRPFGSLLFATDGNLYGMTSNGGINNVGVIFSFDTSSSSYIKLMDFDSPDGAEPWGSLFQASNGKFYGLTLSGGSSNYGVIFSYEPTTATYTKLKDFGTNERGSSGRGSLIQASDKKLYGMAFAGGSKGLGVIFAFDPSSSTYTKLKDFDDTDGVSPLGGLFQASDGKLYGMTALGGNHNLGVLFSFDPATSTYVKLFDFDSTNGANPHGNLMQASNGKIYGMTSNGGSNNVGVIFSLDPSISSYTKVKDFDTDGANPYGGLMQANDGKLYGMASERGGNGRGVIFSFDPSNNNYTKLKDFDGANGDTPFGNLIQANDGKLYGMTWVGGIGNFGVIFSFDPVPATYTKLVDFDDTNGANPHGNLMQASDGKLYGLSFGGGSSGVGVIFSFDILTSTYAKLLDFTGADGAQPYDGSGFIEVNANPLPVQLITFTGKNTGIVNRLSWKVDNEKNLDYYELQRGDDGQNFKAITQIKAAGNNDYSYNDPVSASSSSLYYYRLKNMDKDGKYKYSAIIKIRTDLKGFAVVNPNPFKDRLVVNVASPTQDKVTFIITDINGRQLYKENKLLSPGANVVEIFGSDRLSKGTYLLTIIESQQTQTIKVVKGN